MELFNPKSIPVKSFVAQYAFLSNFFVSPVYYKGIVYETAEHAYQSAKTDDPVWKERVRTATTPGKAKRTGKFLIVKPDWESIKVDVMEEILRSKFRNPTLAKLLLVTGTKELIKGNTWNDTFWGVCNGVGENHLGKLLMKIRHELKC